MKKKEVEKQEKNKLRAITEIMTRSSVVQNSRTIYSLPDTQELKHK